MTVKKKASRLKNCTLTSPRSKCTVSRGRRIRNKIVKRLIGKIQKKYNIDRSCDALTSFKSQVHKLLIKYRVRKQNQKKRRNEYLEKKVLKTGANIVIFQED